MERIQKIAGASCRSPGDDALRVVGRWPLQSKSVSRRLGRKPEINLAGVSQDGRHGIRMGRRDDRVGFRRREIRKARARRRSARSWALGRPLQGVQRPAKAKSGRSSLSANQIGVLRGLVSAYSQKHVAGTTQQLSFPSQRRQCGLLTLRMFVIGAPPNCGGPGIPQRAMTSSRSPSGATLTIGAI